MREQARLLARSLLITCEVLLRIRGAPSTLGTTESTRPAIFYAEIATLWAHRAAGKLPFMQTSKMLFSGGLEYRRTGCWCLTDAFGWAAMHCKQPVQLGKNPCPSVVTRQVASICTQDRKDSVGKSLQAEGAVVSHCYHSKPPARAGDLGEGTGKSLPSLVIIFTRS